MTPFSLLGWCDFLRRKNLLERYFPLSQPPAGVGEKVHVQPRAQPANHASHRAEPQLPEEKPRAETEQQHRARRVELELMHRREKREADVGPGRRKSRIGRAEKIEILPASEERRRQRVGDIMLGISGRTANVDRLAGAIAKGSRRADRGGDMKPTKTFVIIQFC